MFKVSGARMNAGQQRVELTDPPYFAWGLIGLGAVILLVILGWVVSHGLPTRPMEWTLIIGGVPVLGAVPILVGWRASSDHIYVDPSGLRHVRHGKEVDTLVFVSITSVSVRHHAGLRPGSDPRMGVVSYVFEGKSRDGAQTRFEVSPHYRKIEVLYRYLDPYVRSNPQWLAGDDTRRFYNAEIARLGTPESN